MTNTCTHRNETTRRQFVGLLCAPLLLVTLAFESVITAVLHNSTVPRQTSTTGESPDYHPQHPRVVAPLQDNQKRELDAQAPATEDENDVGAPFTAFKVLRKNIPPSINVHKSYDLKVLPTYYCHCILSTTLKALCGLVP